MGAGRGNPLPVLPSHGRRGDDCHDETGCRVHCRNFFRHVSGRDVSERTAGHARTRCWACSESEHRCADARQLPLPRTSLINGAFRLLGRSQVVRHRILIPAREGSNPSAPAHCFKARPVGFTARDFYPPFLALRGVAAQRTLPTISKHWAERMAGHTASVWST